MVRGFLPTLLVGMLGGLLAELIRITGLLKKGETPTLLQSLASAAAANVGLVSDTPVKIHRGGG